MYKLFQNSRWVSMLLLALASLLCLGAAQAEGTRLETDSAASLRAQYVALAPQLSSNQFKRPLYLQSLESPSHLRGEIFALVDYPFATVNQAFNDPSHWCDMLILHINTKYCQARAQPTGAMLAVSIGKKDYQPLGQAYRVDFAYRVATSTPEYFDVGLSAKTGPLGTSDYRIRLDAVAVAGNKTFLHITYSYAYNFAGRLAMQAYLATTGRNKVGFSATSSPASGASGLIGGVRGVVERNTMRYYLAMDAYLGALATPPAQQLEKRLQSWFTSTERYARQLHEVDRATYLAMKRREYQRQQPTR
ncbi:MAG: hypothetical protein KJ614_10630 [Gammaproteobacteria bacterium]|uniref:hypothetical protein n=1 Tax=Rhodoferax sp. TaxID=50421 RepID=UPI001853CDE8|nr:hypothetical protein [Rhodoferax sp.]MBU3899366.1 hypothetical protein [Gammaproteobacteria bacterium]MBA3058388.1 hypothetical protein [Rhodoferax sp.]MBU3997602.1 hypothetical protein [Gammaproteobacteria bacterium]MBU4080621.1 hypothetical protein [Gammaproteobacteria bacterium]MBU4113598.1 hypothetical protein [Gammaproteobacteria bacterium]